MAKITEGYMPYLGYQTYYRIVGESKKQWKSTFDLSPRRTGFYSQLL